MLSAGGHAVLVDHISTSPHQVHLSACLHALTQLQPVGPSQRQKTSRHKSFPEGDHQVWGASQSHPGPQMVVLGLCEQISHIYPPGCMVWNLTKKLFFYLNLNSLLNIILRFSDVESRAIYLCTQRKEKMSGRVSEDFNYR